MQVDSVRGVIPATGYEAANPYVFVVGAARSGTTLLQRMLDAHPLLAVIDETYWVVRKFRERTGLTRAGIVTPALVPLLLASPKFSRMGLTEGDLRRLLAQEQPLSYQRFVAQVFDLFAARRGKPLAGDKTPGYVRRIAQLHELWPRARFVHIIRDPRDVSLSMLDWAAGERTAGQYGTWEIDPVVSTALYWRLSVAAGRDAGEALGPGVYQEVRYEDLVAAPDRELERISEFLRLPYAEAMVRFHEGRTRPGHDAKTRWLAPTPGLRDWRAQLPSSDVERVEAAAGHVLQDAGYEPRCDHFSPTVRDHVAQLQETFTSHLLALGRALPRGW